MSISERTTYERLENGLDTYILPTHTTDVVLARVVLCGGTHVVYDHPMHAALFGACMPSGTKGMPRRTLRDTLAALGARVSVQVEAEHVVLTVAARTAAFDEAFRLAIRMLVAPSFTARDHAEAFATLATDIENSKEDTGAQAATTLRRTFYTRGHPLWIMSPEEREKDLAKSSLAHVRSFHKDTVSAVGGFVCLAGDVQPNKHAKFLREVLSMVPSARPNKSPNSHPGNTASDYAPNTILSMKDRMNVDLLLGIPLAITTEHDDYYALALGVHILGGSATSRLFHSLRTKQSLTYGAYARLAGMTDVHAGYLQATTVVPNDVFSTAHRALNTEVTAWAEKGVTKKEVATHKEELIGRMQVGLASTSGLLGALSGTIQSNKPVSHIDEYPEIVAALTPATVNSAIKSHIDIRTAACVAAGAIDTTGKPLAS